MVRILAVADEIVDALWHPSVQSIRPDLLVACGDLPSDYLDYLQSTVNTPLVFVPGNHDADLVRERLGRSGLLLRAGMPARSAGPPGGMNVDRRVVTVDGLRLAGLGGSVRYRPGANQYSQRQFGRDARRLARRARRAGPVDVLLTHAPPAGLGDGDDPPHRGIEALHDLVDRLHPPLLLHGHIHPYGQKLPDRRIGDTRICNVVGYRVFDIDARTGVREVIGRGA
ncbi:MAG: metallophosphoesterase family protein [Mycobacteriales bacterium]